MDTNEKINNFRKKLLGWYDKNGREFPWRNFELSPYKIIVTEILLQRTKAETVKNYYDKFFNKFPDWIAIKDASDIELENALKPLGLYKHRRARLKKIVNDLFAVDFNLPQNSNQVKESSFSTLYIANAYELFVLKKRKPLLDVNLSRVITRYFEPKEIKDVRVERELYEFSKKLLNVKRCKELNWAIIDYAALICDKKKPKCKECVIADECIYKTNGLIIKEPQIPIIFKSKIEKKQMNKINVLSLFSGCGGMDLGFEGNFDVLKDSINEKQNPDFIKEYNGNGKYKLAPTKFNLVFANDILKDAKNTWINYFAKRGYSDEIFRSESIVDLVKMHENGIKIFPDKVDVVVGGFPCQDFSLAGKRKGFDSHKDHNGNVIKSTDVPTEETRGKLYYWMKKVIEITEPKLFIAENVKGLVNLMDVKNIIQQDFASAGNDGYFVFTPRVLHAADFGIPQSRERIFFIGLKKSSLKDGILRKLENNEFDSELTPYPSMTHAFTEQQNGAKKFVQLKQLFKYLKEPENSKDISHQYYSKAKFMGKHCQGQTEIELDNIAPTIRAEHHGNIEFRRLSKENGGKILNEIENGLIQRRLSVRECAMIQSFPDDFDFVIPSNKNKSKFIVSPSQAYKVIGNAVPPLLAYHIAKRIENNWNKYFK